MPRRCDRVLLHELNGRRKLTCTSFGRSDALVSSDHAPVFASYDLLIPPAVSESEPLDQCVVLLDQLASQPLDMGDPRKVRGDK